MFCAASRTAGRPHGHSLARSQERSRRGADPGEGSLRVVLADFEPPPLPVQIVYPDARLMSPRLRVFVDALREHLRARPEIHRREGGIGEPEP